MNKKLSAVVLCLGVVACGAPVGDDGLEPEDYVDSEDLGTSALALSSSCGTATPDYTYTGFISPTLITNSGSGCTQIVDINSINLNLYMPPFLSPAQMPTNETDCLAARARMYIWDKTGSGTPVYLGAATTYGVWEGPIFGTYSCNLTAEPHTALVSGRSYRFGVSTERPAFSYIDLKLRSVKYPQ
jgi:hypothetical protein